MKQMVKMLIFSFTVVVMAAPAMADELYVFPAKGQSHEQTEKDKYDCYQWAKQNTGFDPMAQPKATTPPPQQQPRKRSVLRGAAAGAAVGGIIDGSDGAGKGAAAGALLGGMRRRNQVRNDMNQQEQWEQEQAAIYRRNRDEYNRAYSACLEGKGYTVK